MSDDDELWRKSELEELTKHERELLYTALVAIDSQEVAEAFFKGYSSAGRERVFAGVASVLELPLCDELSSKAALGSLKLQDQLVLNWIWVMKDLRELEGELPRSEFLKVKKLVELAVDSFNNTMLAYMSGNFPDLARSYVDEALTSDRKARAKHAADERHSQPGGSRERREVIREIWATGKYSSRDICAEEEWQAVGYGSFAAARKALRNTPDPC